MASPITSAMISPEASAAEQSRRDMQAKINGLGGLGDSRLNAEAKARKLREACEGFESIFIQKMWQEMRNTIPKGGMMHGKEERFWQDMYDQELSKSMTKAGGIGLADMMYEQLSRNLVSASRSAVAMSGSSAFVPTAAPLLREAEEETAAEPVADGQGPAQASRAQTAMASVYDGEAPSEGNVENEAAQAEKPATPAQPQAVATAPQQPVAAPQQPLAPVQQPVMATAQQEKPEPVTPAKARKHTNRHYPSGPELAQLAQREAGDKLGPRAVRPPLRKQRERHEEEIAQPQAAPMTPPAQGSRDALRAAMELAKSGGSASQAANPMSLNEMVAQVQARNAASAQSVATAPNAQQTQTVAQAGMENVGPVKTITRFSTNIPKKSRNVKNGKEASNAIRMLNVDNVGVNSKAGQGIAAYHAAQKTANRPDHNVSATPPSHAAEPMAQAAANPQPAGMPVNTAIPPLVAPQASKTEEPASSFSIPPLTAGNSRS